MAEAIGYPGSTGSMECTRLRVVGALPVQLCPYAQRRQGNLPSGVQETVAAKGRRIPPLAKEHPGSRISLGCILFRLVAHSNAIQSEERYIREAFDVYAKDEC